jgi:hypothetical protein
MRPVPGAVATESQRSKVIRDRGRYQVGSRSITSRSEIRDDGPGRYRSRH